MVHASVLPRGFEHSASRLVLEGYGPHDLIKRISASPWLPCAPSGRNFSGIALGELVLADRPDPLCPEKYQITVETVPMGDSFTVEGYQAPHLFDSMRLTARPCTFAGCVLMDDYVGDVTAYRVTVDRLSPWPPQRPRERGKEIHRDGKSRLRAVSSA